MTIELRPAEQTWCDKYAKLKLARAKYHKTFQEHANKPENSWFQPPQPIPLSPKKCGVSK